MIGWAGLAWNSASDKQGWNYNPLMISLKIMGMLGGSLENNKIVKGVELAHGRVHYQLGYIFIAVSKISLVWGSIRENGKEMSKM